MLHCINVSTATARARRLDPSLAQAQNSRKVNLLVFKIMKFLKACDFFKKYSLLKCTGPIKVQITFSVPLINESAAGHLWEP